MIANDGANDGSVAAGWLAVAVVVPAVVGFGAALAADAVTDSATAFDELSSLLTLSASVVVVAHVMALLATWRLTRDPRATSHVLAQPVVVFAGLRVAGAAAVALGFVWPALRHPLAGFAVALVDAAFVAAALAVVAPLFPAPSFRVGVVAVVYVVYRLTFALVPAVSGAWSAPLAWAHRVASVVVVAGVAAVFVAVFVAGGRARAKRSPP